MMAVAVQGAPLSSSHLLVIPAVGHRIGKKSARHEFHSPVLPSFSIFSLALQPGNSQVLSPMAQYWHEVIPDPADELTWSVLDPYLEYYI
jgi:hypothetical protein